MALVPGVPLRYQSNMGTDIGRITVDAEGDDKLELNGGTDPGGANSAHLPCCPDRNKKPGGFPFI